MDIVFTGFLSTIEGKQPPGPKDCVVITRHVIANYVITVKKMYINDAELAGTTRFLSYSEVYVISGLVISRDDLYCDAFFTLRHCDTGFGE